jgi:hypothetical protein
VELTDECIHFREPDLTKVLAAMRAVGCVLDVFSGISRLAIAARCPFLCVDERRRFSGMSEYEIDDLCAFQLPREYIYSFTTIIESGERAAWKSNLYDLITVKLNKFIPSLDRDTWPSTTECNLIVPYERVRQEKSKKLGTRFIKVSHI